MRAWRALAALLAMAMVVSFVRIAHAIPSPQADQLKKEGDAAMDAGRPAEALSAYERAFELAPDTVELLYNMGRARLAIGDFAGALSQFERFSALAPEALKKKTHRLGEVMAELEGKVTTLIVVADADSMQATVSLDGVRIGVVPLRTRVNAGRVEIKVERPGYQPFVRPIDLRGGHEVTVQPHLEREKPPPPPVTRLEIFSTPIAARVLLDGDDRGATPLDLEVGAGPHRVVLTAPKHESRALALTLASGETRRVDLQLTPESPPLTSRWWFWTGIGVVVAGATTAIVAASVERSPSEGTLGTFRGP